jgi:hypothetical protein
VAQLANPDTDFCRSKWFTRGWTLQELIAPRIVNFYNFRWQYIMEKISWTPKARRVGFGAKRSEWHPILEKITRIPCKVLDGRVPLTKITVAARMTWAAHRQTTRKEDMAYCLLGIFQINMSMLYGEGDRAFTRLQEEIIRTSDDETIFTWGFKNGNTHRVQNANRITIENRLLASSPTDFLGCDKIQTLSSVNYSGMGNSMSTHYSMTNKGLLIERPLLVLPAPFYTALVPLNCFVQEAGCPQILALPLQGSFSRPLRGDEACDEAQMVMDYSCCPVPIDVYHIKGDPVKTKIYICNRPATNSRWWRGDMRIQVNIQETSSGMSAKGVYPTWFISPSLSRRDTKSGVYLLSTRWAAAAGLPGPEPPAHALVDLACPNGQRYMVHLVQSLTSMPPYLSFAAGVSKRYPEDTDTAVDDILDLEKEGQFVPEISHALWPTTSDDGYVRLELSGPGDGLPEFVPSSSPWTLKIHVSCGEEAAT